MCVQDIRIAEETDKASVIAQVSTAANVNINARGTRLSIVLTLIGITNTVDATSPNDAAIVVFSDGLAIGMVNAQMPTLILTYQQIGLLVYGRLTFQAFNASTNDYAWRCTEVYRTQTLRQIEQSHGD